MIAALEPGEVVSYGDIAHDAGHPGAARAVGALLGTTDVDLPWWRVVRSDGRLVTADPARQAALPPRRGRDRPRTTGCVAAPVRPLRSRSAPLRRVRDADHSRSGRT